MRIGVDASNLLAGGGVTHLVAALGAADPAASGVAAVVVWGARRTLDALPDRPWLVKSHVPALEQGVLRRTAWQRHGLPRLARSSVDLLWAPGGNAGTRFRPVVSMCRNMLPFDSTERRRYGASWMRLRLEILARSQARTFRGADGVIFLTDDARRRVLARVGPLRGSVAVIPHGVDDRFRRAPTPGLYRGPYGPERPFRLLYVSIVDVYKHPWAVAEAVAALRSKGLPVELDLVGGAYPPALERLRAVLGRLDPEGRFLRYRGPVPHPGLPDVYHGADGFVFASSCENMPNILLEAMAAALPIASSDRGPMPSLLREGGVYFDPERPAAIAGAVERLVLDEPLRERCALTAHARARDFRWERCAAETFDFLRKVGGERGAAA